MTWGFGNIWNVNQIIKGFLTFGYLISQPPPDENIMLIALGTFYITESIPNIEQKEYDYIIMALVPL